jgi:hypothetical protein
MFPANMSGSHMVKPQRKAVTIYYRRLEDVTGAFGGQTLEGAIRAAMGAQSAARKFRITGNIERGSFPQAQKTRS